MVKKYTIEKYKSYFSGGFYEYFKVGDGENFLHFKISRDDNEKKYGIYFIPDINKRSDYMFLFYVCSISDAYAVCRAAYSFAIDIQNPIKSINIFRSFFR